MTNIAIFASGNGSNAQKIAEYFESNETIQVSLIMSNNKNAFVLDRAKELDIAHSTFDRSTFYNTEDVLNILREFKIDFIVLAGFMWLIPDYLVKNYEKSILNIHPALLPKFGGKGMYGDHVHKAVKEAKENTTGITIHYVNEAYDEGTIIFQAKCEVLPTDTVDDIASKVHQLEYKHYPEVVQSVIQKSRKNP